MLATQWSTRTEHSYHSPAAIITALLQVVVEERVVHDHLHGAYATWWVLGVNIVRDGLDEEQRAVRQANEAIEDVIGVIEAVDLRVSMF